MGMLAAGIRAFSFTMDMGVWAGTLSISVGVGVGTGTFSVTVGMFIPWAIPDASETVRMLFQWTADAVMIGIRVYCQSAAIYIVCRMLF